MITYLKMINSTKEWDFMDDKKKKKNDVVIKIATRVGCLGIVISAIIFTVLLVKLFILLI